MPPRATTASGCPPRWNGRPQRGGATRLFPRGDEIDLDIVNCADRWSGLPLITYETWLAEHDRGKNL
jgi:hypothetical protein